LETLKRISLISVDLVQTLPIRSNRISWKQATISKAFGTPAILILK